VSFFIVRTNEQRLFKEKGKQINTIISITIDDYVFKEWDSSKKSNIHRYVADDFKGWQYAAKFEKAPDVLVAALHANVVDKNYGQTDSSCQNFRYF